MLEGLFRELFEAGDVRLLPVALLNWEAAARLRAETRLPVPDAIHAATALEAGCALFLTNDADLLRIDECQWPSWATSCANASRESHAIVGQRTFALEPL